MRRQMLVASIVALAVMGSASSAYAIEVCYDYVIWRLTGTDRRPPLRKDNVPQKGQTGRKDLEDVLKDNLYKKVEPTPKASGLRADDVVIIPGHVGYVTAPNAIDHFIQVEGTTVSTTKSPVGGYRYPTTVGTGGRFVLALRSGPDGRWLIAADLDNSGPPPAR